MATPKHGQTTHEVHDENHVVVFGIFEDPDYTPELAEDPLSLSLEVYAALPPNGEEDEEEESTDDRGALLFDDNYWVTSHNDEQVKTDLETTGLSEELIATTLRIIHKYVDIWLEERRLLTSGS